MKRKKSDCSGFFHLLFVSEILSGAVRITRKAVGYPHLDERLTAHAKVAGLCVQRFHHPGGKVQAYPLRLLVRPAGRCPFHMRGNVLARFKAMVKFFGRKLLFMIHSVPHLFCGLYSDTKKPPSPYFEEGGFACGI